MESRFALEASALAILLFASVATALAQINQPANLQATAPALQSKTNAPVLMVARPKWLTELSLGFREGYDNNVYASGVAPKYYPSTYKGPFPGSPAAIKDQGSFFEIVSPKVAIDFAKLLGDDNILKTLAFSYAPDFVTYHDATPENYTAHRLASTIAAQYNDLSFLLNESFIDIDGSKYGPTYPGKYYNVYGQRILRDRSDQWDDSTTAALTYDQEHWFLRPTAALLDNDYQTAIRTVPTANAGYLNYLDRCDVNGGADLGYKLFQGFAVTVGCRAGYQHQEPLPRTVANSDGLTSSSDYQRMLFGFEGQPLNWLNVKFQAGPDFRNYNADAPVRDRTPVTYYGNGSLTAKASANDWLSFDYCQWRWVSSSSPYPYTDSNYALNYKHQFTDQWSVKLGARAESSDYTCGEYATASTFNPVTATTYYRDDWLYTFSLGVQYDVRANLSLDIAYASELGRNGESRTDLTKLPGTLPGLTRNFDDQTVTVGAKFKF